MKILGISAWYHDSAAAIVDEHEIIAAAQEERFTRIKHDPAFPENAIRYCLDEAGLQLNELDAIAFYDKPFLKFERLLETAFATAPHGLGNFVRSMPVWMKEKLYMKKQLRKGLKKIGHYDKTTPLLFPEHHLSHAASAFYPSGFNEAAILTLDGVGEWATGIIGKGSGKDITVLKETHFPHSVGLLYSAFTYFLGFRVNGGEYKLMGLAPYGETNSERVSRFKQIICENLIHIHEDGSIWMNQEHYRYLNRSVMTNNKSWTALFGFDRREPESEIVSHHCDLALAIQEVTEDIVLKQAAHAKEITGTENLCMAGGVALNCAATGKLHQSGLFKQIFIQPAAGDAGGALGAALAALHIHADQPRYALESGDHMKGAYLGPAPDRHQINTLAASHPHVKTFATPQERNQFLAEKLHAGEVVGWVQGRMEYGPRALGRRSILGDPGNPEMQKRLNLKVKFRESFRPFAPAVLAEEVAEWFSWEGASPYMTFICPVPQKANQNHHPTENMMEQLYQTRGPLPAVTHVNYTARIQTVHRSTNPEFADLLEAFKTKSGYGVLINTSFNVRGEPIVCTAEDALRCFAQTDMDYLALDLHVFAKQPI